MINTYVNQQSESSALSKLIQFIEDNSDKLGSQPTYELIDIVEELDHELNEKENIIYNLSEWAEDNDLYIDWAFGKFQPSEESVIQKMENMGYTFKKVSNQQ